MSDIITLPTSSTVISLEEFENTVFKCYTSAHDLFIDYGIRTRILNNIFNKLNVTIDIEHSTSNKLYNYYLKNEKELIISLVDLIFPKHEFKTWNITAHLKMCTKNILKLFLWYKKDESLIYNCPDFITSMSEFNLLSQILEKIKIFNRQNIERLYPTVTQELYSELYEIEKKFNKNNDKTKVIQNKLLILANETIYTVAKTGVIDDYDFAMELINNYKNDKTIMIKYCNDYSTYCASSQQVLADEVIEKLTQYTILDDHDTVDEIISEFLPQLDIKYQNIFNNVLSKI